MFDVGNVYIRQANVQRNIANILFTFFILLETHRKSLRILSEEFTLSSILFKLHFLLRLSQFNVYLSSRIVYQFTYVLCRCSRIYVLVSLCTCTLLQNTGNDYFVGHYC